jgi:two-component system, OmpR family, KDP operon response regulator KdpE
VSDQAPPGRASIGPEPVQNGLAVVTRILIIEDDRPIRRFLEAALTNAGYEVAEAETGRMGLTQILARMPDLVVLDLGLPDMDGLEIISRVREWSQVPIVVLSARGGEGDKVEALNAGADDYLTKPFGVPELLARIRVALRHAAALKAGGQEEASRFQAGDLVVDLASRRVFVGGVEVHLTPLEYRLLTTLVRNAGKVLTHRYLLREVWGPGYQQQTHYPRMFVASLRRKLEDDPADPRYILTEQGVGYRLVED